MKLKRVPLILALAAGCLVAPVAAGAQQQVGKLSRIADLMNLYPPDAHPPQALRQRLRDLGYVEGENLVIDWRYQLDDFNRLPLWPRSWFVSSRTSLSPMPRWPSAPPCRRRRPSRS